MQTPVEIAYRHYQPSEEVRAEIAAQARRLEALSPRITSCRVVVSGPQNRNRSGDVLEVELRIAMPNHRDIIVDRCRDHASEDEQALIAIRQAFVMAKRQIENAEQEMRDEVKTPAKNIH
jgi:ribosome-associated translation inhibitor RaiA